MKAKFVELLLSIMIVSAGIMGCGSEKEPAAEIVEEVVAETEEEAEEPEEVPLVSTDFHLYIESVDGQNLMAYDADGIRYEVHVPEAIRTEDVDAFLASGNSVTVTVETEGEMEISKEEGAVNSLTASSVAELGEQEAYELSQAVQQITLGYTVEDMTDTTMYAKSSVNVRKGPSAEDEKLGSLNTAAEVTVTGLTSTNWYRVSYNDGVAYVSANYLQNEKPVVQSTPAAGSAVASAEPTEADLYSVYSAAELDAAYASGDMALYNQMLKADIDAFDAKWGTNWGGGGTQPGTAVASTAGSSSSDERSVSSARDFVDYLNQKREEEGLSAMAWSDSMAATAKERAEELVDDLSHSKMRDCSGEIIQRSYSGDIAHWFDNFYNSSGHRYSMMNEYNKTAAAAVCKCGSYYYIVVLFGV